MLVSYRVQPCILCTDCSHGHPPVPKTPGPEASGWRVSGVSRGRPQSVRALCGCFLLGSTTHGGAHQAPTRLRHQFVAAVRFREPSELNIHIASMGVGVWVWVWVCCVADRQLKQSHCAFKSRDCATILDMGPCLTCSTGTLSPSREAPIVTGNMRLRLPPCWIA
mgnify:CR=1 FL=1